MNNRFHCIGLVSILAMAISACSKVDDYMLGQDNTPKPVALEQISPRSDLVKKWSIPVGGAQKSLSYFKMSPSVKGNTIYVASPGGEIRAIEKQSGKTQWSKNLNVAIVSGPVVSNGYLAVGTDDSEIVVLKQGDGQQLWKQRVASDVMAKPVIAHNKLIAKTIDGNLYAFDIATGKKVWASHHGAPNLILQASSSPVLFNGQMLLSGYSDGKLEAVEIDSGRSMWQKSMSYPKGPSDIDKLVDIDADPVIEGDTVYLASYQGFVAALSLKNGHYLWQKPASVIKNIKLSGSSLYYTDSEDVVWSLNKNSGKVNWKQTKLKARKLTEPVYSNNKLYVGDSTGLLHVLAADSGEMIGRQNIGAAVSIAPAVNQNSIYILASNGILSQFQVS